MAGRLLLLCIVLPLVETWLLIKVGSKIGAFPTIGLVILTAVVGTQLVRRQGLKTIQAIQASQARGEMPATQLMEGAALLVAGVLLFTPGFITDTLGFLALIPPLRRRVATYLIRRAVVVTPAGGRPQSPGSRPRDQNTIEGDYRRDDE